MSHLHLRDWSEETHARRVRVELPNGTVVYETRSYAWATSEQNTGAAKDEGGDRPAVAAATPAAAPAAAPAEKEKERLEKAQRLAAAHRAAKKARRAARLPE